MGRCACNNAFIYIAVLFHLAVLLCYSTLYGNSLLFMFVDYQSIGTYVAYGYCYYKVFNMSMGSALVYFIIRMIRN